MTLHNGGGDDDGGEGGGDDDGDEGGGDDDGGEGGGDDDGDDDGDDGDDGDDDGGGHYDGSQPKCGDKHRLQSRVFTVTMSHKRIEGCILTDFD